MSYSKPTNKQDHGVSQNNNDIQEKEGFYVNGKLTYIPLERTPKGTINSPYFITTDLDIQQIVSGYYYCCLLTRDGNMISQYLSDKPVKQQTSGIVQLAPGSYHWLCLSYEGKVYSMGKNQNGECGVGNHEKQTNLVEINFFSKNDKTVRFISAGYSQSYFLTTENELYVCGSNSSGNIGLGFSTNKPSLLKRDVLDVFCSQESEAFMFRTINNQIYGSGKNGSGKLGIGRKETIYTPTLINFFDQKEVVKIVIAYQHSVALIRENGKNIAYSCGIGIVSGHGSNKNYIEFTKIPKLQKNNILQIECGYNHTLAMDDQSQFYFWGSIGITVNHIHTLPKKIMGINFPITESIAIGCGSFNYFIYPSSHTNMARDLMKIYLSGELCDGNIKGIKVHKQMLNCRTSSHFEDIKKILESYKVEEIKMFLKWVYSDTIEDHKLIFSICEKFNIENPKKRHLIDDLTTLYKDSKSKDFTILVSDEDQSSEVDEEEDEDEDEDEDEEQDEVHAHKFILAARSELYYHMFESVTEGMDRIPDYTQRSLETLEILMKYLYTGKIELSADSEPDIVLNELSDAHEYYQLTTSTQFISQLNGLRKKYNIFN
ncbi:btk-binding protein-related [Anaeramoeba flamelloides]|uniref:Btk-binding protein-related n=1 Tax=Anaeramoeba flamelloides TaxID=1746091 RepID=A0ABQ8YU11_9EUKA|nr:btk-binding protein-related [Anaeramoeba flamelloides]